MISIIINQQKDILPPIQKNLKKNKKKSQLCMDKLDKYMQYDELIKPLQKSPS